ncbi:AAA family ATPase [Lichenicoccus roseus]|uniref:AAA family ATPase n=1 Tax=Lichenicoccus roseus TaxID=2683649 RepID=A0A5R9IYM6_9PROT|nr:AAA family ATPase [Lichenicoccus roseus]TLU70580.1 AAA family ATPase [Lichenicoccus roseus]
MRDVVAEYGEVESYHADIPFPGEEPDSGKRERLGSGARQEPKDDAGLVFDEDDWLEADIPQRPWIAKGYLLRRSVTILAGVPGGGKSSLAVSWATSLATGAAFGEFDPIKPRRVLTYNTEDDRDEQRRRFSASLRQFGRIPADLNGQVVRVGIERIGTLFGDRFTEDGSSLGFGPLPAMKSLKKRIEQFKPDVIILDPLVELHDRDENDNTELRRVVAEFRTLAIEHDAAVVLLHHTKKGSGSAVGDADSIRGAGAIVGAGRIALTITKMSEDDAKNYGISEQSRRHYLRLDEAKANYSETPVDWFEKNVHQLDNGEGVMALAPWETPVDAVSVETRALIENEVALGSSVGPWSPKLSADPRSIRNLLLRHGVTTAKGQKGVVKGLQDCGITIQNFRHESRREAQGFRTADGRPAAKWVSEAETE